MDQQGIWQEEQEHQILVARVKTPFIHPYPYRKTTSQLKHPAHAPSPKLTLLRPHLPQSFQLELKREETSSSESGEQNSDSQSEWPYPLSLQGCKWLYQKYVARGGQQGNKNYFASLIVPLHRIKEIAKKKPIYSLKDLEIDTPRDSQFDSDFESGNLYAATLLQSSFHLYLSNDVNSTGNTQWFFFTLRGPFYAKSIRFQIMNLGKPDSLFAHGMKPLVRTISAAQKGNWRRLGLDITYLKSPARKVRQRNRHYHSLNFTIPLEHPCDQLQVSYSYPYTYQQLKQYLQGINSSLAKSRYCKHEILCKSLGGVPVSMLVIGDESRSAYKSTVLIMGRQHPGETPSSFTIEGIVNYLLAKTKEAEFLRHKYVFRVIPFMNVDGVLFGNYRASLTGKDPNRQWDTPQPSFFPEIVAVKELVSTLSRKNRLKAVFDIHSHSRKMKSFFYGVNYGNPLQSRLLPFFCSRLCKDISFEDSIFHLSKCKQKTARAVLAKISAGCPYIYTYELSFFGTIRNGHKVHFQPQDYSQLGQELVSGLYHMLLDESQKESGVEEASFFEKMTRELRESKILQKMGDRDSGSEIDPSEDQLDLDMLSQQDQAKPEHIPGMSQVKSHQAAPILSYYRERIQPSRYNELEIKKILPTIKDRSLMCLEPIKSKRNCSFSIQNQKHSKVRETRRSSLEGLSVPSPINHSFNLNIRSIQKELEQQHRLIIEPLKFHIKQGRRKGKGH